MRDDALGFLLVVVGFVFHYTLSNREDWDASTLTS